MSTEIQKVNQNPRLFAEPRPPTLPFYTEPGSGSEEFDWRRTIDVLLAGKWTVIGAAVGMLALGVLVMILLPPTYKADGLIQISQDKDSRPANASGNQAISYDINGNTLTTLGEIEVLQSRMVFMELIDRLNLLIDAHPNYFPIVGNAIYRSNASLAEPAEVPELLRHFAWGGEQINVSTFEVPRSLEDKKFLVRATERGYDLIDPDGQVVLSGKTAELAKQGPFAILVDTLLARAGTTFVVTKYSLQTALESLGDKLVVEEKTKESGIIQLAYKAKKPEVAESVINNVEDIYANRNTEWRAGRALELENTLRAQLPHLKSQVDQAQQQINAYQLKHGSVDVSQETQLLLQRGVDLETQRLTLSQQREEAVQRFTARHPTVISIDEKLDSIDAELQKLKVQAAALPATQQEMLNRTRDLDVANQLYTDMLNTIQQQQVIQAGTLGNAGGKIRVLDRAYLPEKPSFPKVKVVIPVAFLLGGLFGVGFVLTRDYLVNAIYDETELESRLGLATLGRIPFSKLQSKLTRRRRRQKIDTCLLAESAPEDPAVESLRKLRSALYLATYKASNNVIVVAGPTAGIGKSFIALNLASLLAFSGKRVVLVDADLFNGNLYHLTGRNASPGLTDCLSGSVPVSEIIQLTSVDKLEFVAQGTVRPNGQELLLQESFETLLRHLSGRYDHVVVDTPGNISGSAAAVVGRHAGCTLLVVRSGTHSLKQVEDSYRLLTNAGASVRGVIFNHI